MSVAVLHPFAVASPAVWLVVLQAAAVEAEELRRVKALGTGQRLAIDPSSTWEATTRTVVVDPSIDIARDHLADLEGRTRRRVKVIPKDAPGSGATAPVLRELTRHQVIAGAAEVTGFVIAVTEGRKPQFKKCIDCRLPFEVLQRRGSAPIRCENCWIVENGRRGRLGPSQRECVDCKSPFVASSASKICLPCSTRQHSCDGCGAPLVDTPTARRRRLRKGHPWMGVACGCTSRANYRPPSDEHREALRSHMQRVAKLATPEDRASRARAWQSGRTVESRRASGRKAAATRAAKP